MEEVLEMSSKERDRYRVLNGVVEGRVTQIQAAELLNITDRQVRNLVDRMKTLGAQGLVSRKRGRPSNRRLPESLKHRVLSIVKEQYHGFGPSFVSEKLQERHKVKISKETIRHWMLDVGLWKFHQKKIKTHPLRQRRSCFGEMIQIDGSHEFWFEDRGERCVLIVFIDDATGKLTSLYFSKGESLEAYFRALEKHLVWHGRPREIYSDRFSVFDSPVEGNLTQFKRALTTLGIKSILALSPQAKGRVERVNRTLQDRLIKELRLRKIDTIEEANKFVDEFIEMHNKKFSKEPASPFNAHRPLGKEVDLSRVLSRYEERTVTKDSMFQFHNKFYKITEEVKGTILRGRKVEVRTGKGEVVRVFLGNTELKVSLHSTTRGIEIPIQILSEDQIRPRLPRAPSATHPWKIVAYRQRTREFQLLKKIV
jgi:hypothetical protein